MPNPPALGNRAKGINEYVTCTSQSKYSNVSYLNDLIHKRVYDGIQQGNLTAPRRSIDSFDNFSTQPFEVSNSENRVCPDNQRL